jgi:hypothetical protein
MFHSPGSKHGDPGACLMAPGYQVVIKLRTNNMDWQMQNPDRLEHAFRNATDFCVSQEGHSLFSVRISDKETLHSLLSQEFVH